MGSKSYSKGISWIDDCRIPFEDDIDLHKKQNQKSLESQIYGGGNGFHTKQISMDTYKPQGRFPANILVSDDMLNDGGITKVQDNLKEKTKQYKGGNFGGGSVKNNFYFGDKGTNSRYYDIDKWFDKILDK